MSDSKKSKQSSKRKSNPAKNGSGNIPSLSDIEREDFEKMLERLGIDSWDWILIGDGSGSNWDYQCGWGCVSIERDTFERRVWAGCMSQGTVNFAEMMAYLQPLTWFNAQEDAKRKHTGKARRPKQIHIITDSDYVRSQGESGDMMPKRNGALWRIFEDFVRQGLVLNWHWVRRETVGLNIYADLISKSARGLIKDNPIQERVETVNGTVTKTVYNYNPT